MKFYKVDRCVKWQIEEIEVDRYTDKSIWIDGRRQNRFSNYDNYFPTHEEAKAHALRVAEREVSLCERKLKQAEEEREYILTNL